MARYARVENGVAVDLIDTGDYLITQLFAKAFVESMVLVPEGKEVDIGAPIGDFRPGSIEQSEADNPVVPVTPADDEQESLSAARTWRQSSFSSTEWWVTRHRDEQELGRGTTLKAQQYLELLEYRQALRDWPDSDHFPAVVSRPSIPVWM